MLLDISMVSDGVGAGRGRHLYRCFGGGICAGFAVSADFGDGDKNIPMKIN